MPKFTRSESRSREAVAYRRLYQTPGWRRIRAQQLAEEPFCKFCLIRGIRTPATVVDHVNPHRGDPDKFYSGPFQSLCGPCHDSAKSREELAGYDSAPDEDGWPMDPRHPANSRKTP